MHLSVPRLVAISSSLLLALVFSGCATTPKETTQGKEAEKDEYIYVTETGSRIPTKVKKSRGKSDATNLEQGDQRTLEQMQRDQTLRTMRRDGS